MNIPEIIEELQKLAPDVPPEKRDDIAGFFVVAHGAKPLPSDSTAIQLDWKLLGF